MKTFISLILKLALPVVLLSQVACSERWYEVEPGLTGTEVDELIGKAGGQISQFSNQSASLSLINEINQNRALVYVKSSNNGFPAKSVLQITDMGVFNQNYFGVSVNDINLTQSTVMLLDGFSNSGQRHFALIIQMVIDGQEEIFAFVSQPGEYQFTDNSLTVFMNGADETPIALITNDLDDDFSETLGSNIKFEVYADDGFGADFYAGQFAPLAGLE